MYTNPPTQESASEGPNLLLGSCRKTESWLRAQQMALFPLRPLPHIQRHNAVTWVAPTREYLRLRLLLCNRHTKTKNMTQMKEQIKAPEKIQLSDEEIANLSDSEFKTLVIRKLTEIVE